MSRRLIFGVMNRVYFAVALLAGAASAVPEFDYRLLVGKYNFADAEAICSNPYGFNGNLASVTDSTEAQFLTNMAGEDVFVGGERIPNVPINSVNWRWTDGSPFPNDLWANREPNNWRGSEACATLTSNNNKMNDVNCGRRFAAICKRPHVPNPLIGDGFTKRDGSNCWYKYYNNILKTGRTEYSRRNWWDAQGFCRSDIPVSGGNLVSITDQSEADWIRNLIRVTYNEWTWRPIWIGLSKVGTGAESWSSGEPFVYTDWMPGEPNQKTNDLGWERCAQMSHTKDKDIEIEDNIIPPDFGKWNDAACRRKRGWICEVCTDDW